MSQKCVGYVGEGRSRKPVWRDEGPASAAAVSPMARLDRLSATGLRGIGEQVRVEGGAGPIERREATQAQREAWRDEDVSPERSPMDDMPMSPAARVRPPMGSPEHLQQSRLRGGAANAAKPRTAASYQRRPKPRRTHPWSMPSRPLCRPMSTS